MALSPVLRSLFRCFVELGYSLTRSRMLSVFGSSSLVFPFGMSTRRQGSDVAGFVAADDIHAQTMLCKEAVLYMGEAIPRGLHCFNLCPVKVREMNYPRQVVGVLNRDSFYGKVK